MVLYNKRKTFYKTVKNCNKKTIYNKIKDITIYNKKYITIYNKKTIYNNEVQCTKSKSYVLSKYLSIHSKSTKEKQFV